MLLSERPQTPPVPALLRCVHGLSRLLDMAPGEPERLAQASRLLADLVAQDNWLPAAWARPDPQHYQQYLLHRDPQARFSVVSFVWGPGQATPVHNHTVWGLIGMLRGAEDSQHYQQHPDGRWLPDGPPQRLMPGQVAAVSPTLGDVHRVCNALPDRVSISIHVYGADIGVVRRTVFLPDGSKRPFVSGYSAPRLTEAAAAG